MYSLVRTERGTCLKEPLFPMYVILRTIYVYAYSTEGLEQKFYAFKPHKPCLELAKSGKYKNICLCLFLFQIKDVDSITLEDALEILRYPLTLVCFFTDFCFFLLH